jgi:hypothetical protein
MELPHLTLYLRRFRTPVATPGGLRLAPSRHALCWLLSGAVWFLLAAVYFAWGRIWSSAPDGLGGTWAGSGIVLVANVWLYLSLASGMMQLIQEPSALRRGSKRHQAEPLWFASSLDSMQAVLGIALSSLMAILPVSLGALWLVHTSFGPEPDGSLPVLAGNVFSLLRQLPMALAFGSLAIALRRNLLQPLLPVLFTATAVLAALGDNPAAYGWDPVIGRDPFGPGSSASFWTIVLGTALSLALFNLLLRWQSRAQTSGAGAGLPLLLLVAVPLLAGALGTADQFYWSGLSDILTTRYALVLQAPCATFLPDVSMFRLLEWDNAVSSVEFYGWSFPPVQGLLLASIFYLATTVFWLLTAVHCLDAARNRSAA